METEELGPIYIYICICTYFIYICECFIQFYLFICFLIKYVMFLQIVGLLYVHIFFNCQKNICCYVFIKNTKQEIIKTTFSVLLVWAAAQINVCTCVHRYVHLPVCVLHSLMLIKSADCDIIIASARIFNVHL